MSEGIGQDDKITVGKSAKHTDFSKNVPRMVGGVYAA